MKSKITHIKKHVQQLALCFLLAAHFAQVGNYIPPSFHTHFSLGKEFPFYTFFDNLLASSDTSENPNSQENAQHHIEHAGADTYLDVFDDEVDMFFAFLLHPQAEPSYTLILYKDNYCEQPHPELSSPPPQFF